MKKYNIMFIICFISIIIFPLIMTDKIGGKISSVENRYLSKFPNIVDSENRLNFKDFNTNFENFINDNIGFREQASKLNNVANYIVFDEFFIKDVFKGKNDWLYYVPNYDMNLFQNKNLPTKNQINTCINKLSEINNYLKTKKIEFIYLTYPNKYTVYPEFISNNILKVNSNFHIDIWNKALSNNENFDFATPINELKKEKGHHILYSKASDLTHWNSYGAFIGYKKLMNLAKKHIYDLKILSENDFKIIKNIKTTKLGAGLFKTTEIDYEFLPLFERKAFEDKSFFEQINYESEDIWHSYRYYVNKDTTLPKAIVVGDSYIYMFMLPDIAESFSEVVFIHLQDIKKITDLCNIIHPNIVIMEILEHPEVCMYFPIKN